MLVRCNNCMKYFDENKIIYDSAEEMESCPECGEGGCIMDIELNAIEECIYAGACKSKTKETTRKRK